MFSPRINEMLANTISLMLVFDNIMTENKVLKANPECIELRTAKFKIIRTNNVSKGYMFKRDKKKKRPKIEKMK